MSTLLQLRTRVRYNLGEVTGEQRFKNVSINANINEAYQQYQLDLIESGEGDFLTLTTINFVANQANYALPADWVKTERIERQLSDGSKRPLRYDKRMYRPNPSNIAYSGDFYRPTYRYRNRDIIFEPTPQVAETAACTHEYYALQPIMGDDTQSPAAGFIEPWQTMLVLYATIAELEGKDAIGGVADIATFRARLEQAETKFRDSLENRSESPQEVEPYGDSYDDYILR